MDGYTNLDLTERGTRYQHYAELIDVFGAAKTILQELHPAHRTGNEPERIKKLDHAIELIQARIDNLSEFHNKSGFFSEMRRTVEEEIESLYDHMQARRQLTGESHDEKNENNAGTSSYSPT